MASLMLMEVIAFTKIGLASAMAFSAPVFMATSTFSKYGPAKALAIGFPLILETASCTSSGIKILYAAFLRKPPSLPNDAVPANTPFSNACLIPEAASP